jgi:hypothetical protein
VLVLDTHDTTTPVTAELFVVVELLSEVDGKLLEVLEVLLVDFGQSNAGSVLHVAELTEVGLSADEAVRNVLSAAKSGQVDHNLNGVNVVSDHNELGGTLFDEGGDVVKTELDVDGLGSLAGTTSLSSLLEAVLLLGLGLGHVLSEELEELGSLVLVNGVGELVDGWWDLEALEEDSLLSLDTDVLGPLDEAGQVANGLDVTTDTEVLGGLLEKGVFGVGGLGVTNDNLLTYFLNLFLRLR